MSVSVDVLSDIQNATLEVYIDKGKVWKQGISNRPMLKDFNDRAGNFPGGKEQVSWAVKSGLSGGALQGYSFDDQVSYYDPTGIKRCRAPWREHHIGITMTHTELKEDGIDIDEAGGADQTTSKMSGREQYALANRLDESMDSMAEDYRRSLELLIHGDGTADPKSLAGVASIILDNPLLGSTFGVSRTANTWWRNRAATAAYAAAGGQGPITSSAAGGGALITFLEKEERQLNRYSSSADRRYYCGSDFLAAYQAEIRSNGYYSQTGFRASGTVDGKMGDPAWNGKELVYDPCLDDLGLSKRMYAIDMSKQGVRLLYMDGNRMKKHKPARPYDRYMFYSAVTMTGLMIAKKLNTSAVYDIA